MGRRARIVVVVVLGAVVVLVAGGYAVLALTGDDAPPPPRLEGRPAGGATTPAAAGRWHPVPAAGTFVGYRVNEEYLGVGVRTAVGRTSAVTGSVTVTGDRVRAADLRVDMRTLRSDQAPPRRHPALPRHRDRPLPGRAASPSPVPWRSAPAAGRRPAR